MDKDVYNNIISNSTNGHATSAKAEKTLRFNEEKFKNRVIGLCCTCVAFGAITGTPAINFLTNKISENMEIDQSLYHFKQEVIFKNTHRTDDLQAKWYDTDAIANYVKTDEDVYLVYRSIGEENTNKVLESATEYNSVDQFLEAHHYKDVNEWKKVANKQLLLSNEISKNQEELQKMQSEYSANQINSNIEQPELGGK